MNASLAVVWLTIARLTRRWSDGNQIYVTAHVR